MAHTWRIAVVAACMVLSVSAVLPTFSPRLKRTADSDFFTNPDIYTFDKYVHEFGKKYEGEGKNTYQHRRGVFHENMRTIRKINEKYAAGIYTWMAGPNQFTDLTAAEMKAFKGHSKRRPAYPTQSFEEAESELLKKIQGTPLPTSVDWRTKGVVTPVKDQGGCGSCWAFSATEVIESAVAIAGGKLPVLGPQQFVDCVQNPDQCGGTGGCEGATQQLAFNYTMHHGQATEADYPYTGSDGTCATGIKPTAGVKGFVSLKANDWTQLMTAVAYKGPISISVAANLWQFYFGGVLNAGDTCGYDIDHGVVAVGYGVDTTNSTNPLPYWIVRNSWNEWWGEQGYIRVYRSPNATAVPCGTDTSPDDGFGCKGGPQNIQVCGECGILSDSSYPTGAFLY